jgi:integrase
MRDCNHRDEGRGDMAKERLKHGSVARKHGAWYWRHYVEGKQKWEKIAEISDRYRSKGDVIPLINAREIEEPREGEDSTIADFVEKEYLTWAKANKRPATYNGYAKLWESRVKDHVGEMRLSEYRPFHASRFLGELAPKMTTASLQHVRALLSGIFAHAVADGRVDVNPIRDAKCRTNPKPSRKVEHYTAKEMRGILTLLKGRELGIMSLAFIGLRPAEIIGLRWEDVSSDAIHVQRSMWRGQVNEGGKSERSNRLIPLGRVVAAILAQYRKDFPSTSGFVFENTIGRALDTSGLAKLIRESIRPTLAKHGYNWKAMYAGRRGAITEANRYTNGNAQVAAALFGHTPEVEVKHYVRELPDATRSAALALDSALQETNERQGVNADVKGL